MKPDASRGKKPSRRRHGKLTLPALDFKPHDHPAPYTPLCAQTFVSRADKVPHVTIVSVVRSAHAFAACMRAVLDHTGYPNWHWQVIDATPRGLCELTDPRITVSRAGDKATHGARCLRNYVAARSASEYVAFLDVGCRPEAFWLYAQLIKLRHLGRSNHRVGLVATYLQASRAGLLDGGWQRRHATMRALVDGADAPARRTWADADRLVPATRLYMAVMRRQDFVSLGGFNEGLPVEAQDIDLCWRLQAALHKKVLLISGFPAWRASRSMAVGLPVRAQKALKDINVPACDQAAAVVPVDVSCVTCINNLHIYSTHVLGSLLLNFSDQNVQLLPVYNLDNRFCSASALQNGIDRAHADVVILCHQDIIFFKAWLEILRARVAALPTHDWCILGVAGVTARGEPLGAVLTVDGTYQWYSRKWQALLEVQTVDECCMVYRKSSQVSFDSKIIDNFHFYGADICLQAIDQGMHNFGIHNPLVHNGTGGSISDQFAAYDRAFIRFARKWSPKFSLITTPTGTVIEGKVHSCLHS